MVLCSPDSTLIGVATNDNTPVRHGRSTSCLCRAGPPRVGGGPQARGAARSDPVVHGCKRCRVQASRLVRSSPPGSTPAHRPDAGVHVKAAATGAKWRERHTECLALTGWRRAVGWSKGPVGPHAAGGRDEQRCRGRHNAVILLFAPRPDHAQHARLSAQTVWAAKPATRAGCRLGRRFR